MNILACQWFSVITFDGQGFTTEISNPKIVIIFVRQTKLLERNIETNGGAGSGGHPWGLCEPALADVEAMIGEAVQNRHEARTSCTRHNVNCGSRPIGSCQMHDEKSQNLMSTLSPSRHWVKLMYLRLTASEIRSAMGEMPSGGCREGNQ